jgi:hypothetical protein
MISSATAGTASRLIQALPSPRLAVGVVMR